MPPRKIANIPDRQNSVQPMFVTWEDDKGKKAALMTAAQASAQYGAIASKERAYGSDIFMNAGTNVSVRDGISRRDWEYFRPEEAIPRDIRNIIGACMMAYKRIGFIKNVIDTMAEFTCQGIKIVHQNPRIQDLCQQWGKKVGLKERSERFCNYLYRTANVIVQRETAIVREKDLDNLRKGLAAEDIQPIDTPPPVRKGEIPWSYTFINPMSLDILGGDELAQFAGVAVYGLTIPERVYNKIRNPKTPEEKYIVSQIPDLFVNHVRNGKKIIPLDPNKVQAFFYKKDDWQVWAEPITYGVIDDLILFNKMRLADLSALDGAISHIRLWRLGDLANHIFPTPAAIARLAEVLVNNTAVGAIDLIWGPELTLEETSTDVYRFLGSEKYGQTMQNIYDGMGVPYPNQAGGKGKGGMASYLSLRVMIERLKYGRDILNSFWEPELIWLQKALGLRIAPQLQYDYMVLSDENAFLRLLIDLIDRDIIAAETVQEAFGRIPEIEQAIIRSEHRKRASGKMKAKAGPYHSPQVEDDLLKIFAQSGIITPSEAGVELGDRAKGEKTMMELKLEQAKQAAKVKQANSPFGGGNPNGNPDVTTKQKGKPGQGRPPGQRDTQPRKQRALKPAKAVDFFSTRAWARQVQATISEVVSPIYCESCGKDTVRKLTDEETKNLEEFKFALLCNLEPYAEFNEEILCEMVKTPLPIPPLVSELLAATLGKFTEKFARAPSVDETRLFQAEVYSLYTQGDDDGEDVQV
jgi:hypothetical protein